MNCGICCTSMVQRIKRWLPNQKVFFFDGGFNPTRCDDIIGGNMIHRYQILIRNQKLRLRQLEKRKIGSEIGNEKWWRLAIRCNSFRLRHWDSGVVYFLNLKIFYITSTRLPTHSEGSKMYVKILGISRHRFLLCGRFIVSTKTVIYINFKQISLEQR